MEHMKIRGIQIAFDGAEYAGTFFAATDSDIHLTHHLDHDKCMELLRLMKWEFHQRVVNLGVDYNENNMFYTKVEANEQEVKNGSDVQSEVNTADGNDNPSAQGFDPE